MKAAEKQCKELSGHVENIQEALNELSQASTEMGAMRFDTPMPVAINETEDAGDCQMQ